MLIAIGNHQLSDGKQQIVVRNPLYVHLCFIPCLVNFDSSLFDWFLGVGFVDTSCGLNACLSVLVMFMLFLKYLFFKKVLK